MSNKDIIFWVILLIIMGVLIFTTPTMDSQISGKIWIVFITIIIAIVLIKLISNTRKSKTTENTHNNTHIIIKVLWALLVISIILETVLYNSPGIITTNLIFLLLIAYFCQWFFKKEE